jgi:hypothetical protein
VRRIARQFSAALVQIFASVDQFLAGIGEVFCSLLSFTPKIAASPGA